MLLHGINALGRCGIKIGICIAHFASFLGTLLITLSTTRWRFVHILTQLDRIGVQSSLIVLLTGAFTGVALALQGYIALYRLGGQELIGLFIAFGMTRELGPVLTGLMVMGRAGSAMAAELGTMQITEQIEALRTLHINPYQYLLVPRLVACSIALPVLTLFAMTCGIVSGYLVGTNYLGISGKQFITLMQQFISLSDVVGGLLKAFCFGLIIAIVSCYQGFMTQDGARGVGLATTQSVVIGSIVILLANCVLSMLLYQVGMT